MFGDWLLIFKMLNLICPILPDVPNYLTGKKKQLNHLNHYADMNVVELTASYCKM